MRLEPALVFWTAFFLACFLIIRYYLGFCSRSLVCPVCPVCPVFLLQSLWLIPVALHPSSASRLAAQFPLSFFYRLFISFPLISSPPLVLFTSPESASPTATPVAKPTFPLRPSSCSVLAGVSTVLYFLCSPSLPTAGFLPHFCLSRATRCYLRKVLRYTKAQNTGLGTRIAL